MAKKKQSADTSNPFSPARLNNQSIDGAELAGYKFVAFKWPPGGTNGLYSQRRYVVLVEIGDAEAFHMDNAHAEIVQVATARNEGRESFLRGPRQRAACTAARNEFIHKLRTDDQIKITRWSEIKAACVGQGLCSEATKVKTLRNSYSAWLKNRPA